MLLFEFPIHQKQRLAELFRTVLQSLLKKISRSLQLLPSLHMVSTAPRKYTSTHVSLDKLGQVDVPDLESDWEMEQLDTPLVDLETLLKVLVLLEESSIVDDDLSICDLELHDLVVDCLGRLDGADRLLEVAVEGPDLERLEQSLLRGDVLWRVSDEAG
jgi:hypothetical protein